jgi:peptidoglycan/LPS O-acetylase OafA/YrhL
MFSKQKWLQVTMTNRLLIYTGTISYGLYLLHKIPFGMVQALHWDRHSNLPLPIILVTSFALAALSWNLLEKPFLNLKRFFVSKPPHPLSTPLVRPPSQRMENDRVN